MPAQQTQCGARSEVARECLPHNLRLRGDPPVTRAPQTNRLISPRRWMSQSSCQVNVLLLVETGEGYTDMTSHATDCEPSGRAEQGKMLREKRGAFLVPAPTYLEPRAARQSGRPPPFLFNTPLLWSGWTAPTGIGSDSFFESSRGGMAQTSPSPVDDDSTEALTRLKLLGETRELRRPKVSQRPRHGWMALGLGPSRYDIIITATGSQMVLAGAAPGISCLTRGEERSAGIPCGRQRERLRPRSRSPTPSSPGPGAVDVIWEMWDKRAKVLRRCGIAESQAFRAMTGSRAEAAI
ncbi:hypothetical protein BJV74DRAFT_989634 [Russula compacta]|nr:hypothetical protein BJV74DRAFT_989634 [Russula compacta]